MAVIDVSAELLETPAPWAGTAWGSVQGDDYSTVDPIDALREYPGELAWILRVEAHEIGVGRRDVLVSSHGYHLGRGGDGASDGLADFAHFIPALANPGTTKSSVIHRGSLGAGSIPSHGSFKLANADGRLDDLRQLRFSRRPFTLWVGEARWMGPSFLKFARIRRGTIKSASWNDSELTLTTRPPQDLAAIDVNPDAYLGFGTAVRLRAAGDGVSVTGTQWNPPEFHWRVMVEVEVPGNAPVLNLGWDEATGGGWELRVLADGSVLWVQGAYGRILLTEAGLVPPSAPRRLSVSGGADGVKVYVDGALAAEDAVAYVAPAGTPSLMIGRRP